MPVCPVYPTAVLDTGSPRRRINLMVQPLGSDHVAGDERGDPAGVSLGMKARVPMDPCLEGYGYL